MRGRERLRALKKGPLSARIEGQCQLRPHPVWPSRGHGAGPPCGVGGARVPASPPPGGGRRLRTPAPRTGAPGASWVLARPGAPNLLCAALDRGAPRASGVLCRALASAPVRHRTCRGPIRKVSAGARSLGPIPPAPPSLPPAAPAPPPAAGGVSGRDDDCAHALRAADTAPPVTPGFPARRCAALGTGPLVPPRTLSFPVHPARSPAVAEGARRRSPAAG